MDPHETGEFCLVCASAAYGLQCELEEWTASSSNEQLAAEDKPKFNFWADSLDLRCIVCKNDTFPPVLQVSSYHVPYLLRRHSLQRT